MRFSRIDLIRYGALTERTLTFRPDAALHVVYGPNEAGKSSALYAISDLLFGFPDRTEQGFLHDPKDLRIGAALVAKAGNALSFRRRKGRKNTLLADDGEERALPDDALLSFIGGLDRTVFERAFGLNSGRLRAGAQEMLQSGGEIGSLLFSAASGMMGLTRLKRALEDEAEGIYAPRKASNRAFYQALDRHDEARRAERESELKAGDWKRLLAAVAEAEAELAALDAHREETRRALERLRTLRKLEPLIREIDAEEMLLGDFSDLDALPPGLGGQLAAALEGAERAEAALQRAEEDEENLRATLSGLSVDERLLAAQSAITARFAETGAYQKNRQDLPRIEAEADEFDQKLAGYARRLGLPAQTDLESVQPPEAALARLRELLEAHGGLKREREALAARLEEERDYLAALERKGPAHLPDPQPFEERLAALQPELPELSRIEALAAQRQRTKAGLFEQAARLHPAVTDIEALFSVALPDAALLSAHRQRLESLKAEGREAAKACAALEEELSGFSARLKALESEGSIVTRVEITDARTCRDGQWHALRSDLAAGSVPETDRLDAFAALVAGADRLADEALAGADRLSRHAQLQLRMRELETALAPARERREAAAAALAQAEAGYAALFAASGIAPLSPEEMLEWRRGVERLAEARERLGELEEELETLKAREKALRPALLDMAAALSLSGAENLPLSVLYRELARRVSALAEGFAEGRAQERERRTAREKIEKLEEKESALRQEILRFESDFSAACLAAGLQEGATPAMADAALELWRRIPETLAERENRRRRVRGMRRDLAAFEEAVAALAGDLAPDLAPLSADAALNVLHRRAGEAKAAGERRDSLRRTAAEAAHRLAEARQAAAETRTALAALAPEGDAAALLQRLADREALRERLAESRARFAAHADGMGEAEARRSLEGFDRIGAGLEIERLEAEDREGVARFAALNVRLAELKRERERLESGPGAERAVLERLSAETEARDLARQWVVLKLAAGLLNATVETYREQQADPVMRRAGTLFSEVTGGRFTRLVQLYDERDELQLLAERDNGEQVPLPGLSEGTADQLYLALRLAFIEDYATRNEPVPLIADDIFQTFDEERTAAGLATLAAIGGRFQTILFTHQKSVAEIAARQLGDAADILTL